MSQLERGGGENVEEYQYFRKQSERRDVYTFTSGFAEYLATNGISNVVFIDRSARTAYAPLDEYWKLKLPDAKKPGFFFINPDGLDPAHVVNTELQNNPTLRLIARDLLKRGKAAEVARQKILLQIQKRFQDTFKHLMDEKNKPLVLFDTCAHGGSTFKLVLPILKQLGFTDVRVVTAHTPEDRSGVDSAVRLDAHLSAAITCYPFGRDDLIEKGSDVVSVPSSSEDSKQGPLIRSELRSIIRKCVEGREE